MTPSPRAIALIEQFEIGGWASYSPRVSWPGGASGLTIGCGYDLGYETPAQIVADWAALPAPILARLRSYAGCKGNVARAAAPACRDIAIPAAVARAVFESGDIPRYSAMTVAAFKNCGHLSGDSFGALVSLVFNRGAGMADSPDYPNSRLEMRQIRDAMAGGSFAAVPDLIRAMKRLWIGKGLDGLLARRDAEADLFAAGLGIVAPTPPAPPSPAPLTADDLNARELARVST